jgi:hypothetical protein
MKLARFTIALLCAAVLSGCRSHVVYIKLINTSNQPISTIIVDYPNATFGKDKLAPNETFSYAIKPLETGAMKVQFSDANGGRHTYTGPILHKDEDGAIDVKIDQNGAVAIPNVAGLSNPPPITLMKTDLNHKHFPKAHPALA